MAVNPADLLIPVGELRPELFPDRDAEALTAQLQTWIEAGTALTVDLASLGKQDEGIAHYVYAKAYTDIYLRLSGAPIAVDLKSTVAIRMDAAQLRSFATLAETHQRALDKLMDQLDVRIDAPNYSFTQRVKSSW